jgi:DNA repair protein RecO (recombination protein O)
MSQVSTPAIILRRVEFGDFDLICTFFSLQNGKVPLIAKSAKKSTKRFSGILEPFSALQIVYRSEQKKGLPVLLEASILEPFSNIRMDIHKTAYAGYMAELINEWMEERVVQSSLFYLFQYALEAIDQEGLPLDAVSILFQMRFMTISGFRPNLIYCSFCKTKTEDFQQNRILFDLKKGGVVCDQCTTMASSRIHLSKGTIKQLLWLERVELKKAARIRFSPMALKEGLDFLEAFVPFHLGKEPRSLKFIQQIRR